RVTIRSHRQFARSVPDQLKAFLPYTDRPAFMVLDTFSRGRDLRDRLRSDGGDLDGAECTDCCGCGYTCRESQRCGSLYHRQRGDDRRRRYALSPFVNSRLALLLKFLAFYRFLVLRVFFFDFSLTLT